MNPALEIESLHKSFTTGFLMKSKTILKGISLSVERGEIFGYLGPNGAGKTTTIKCLLGLIFPEKGRIEILGHPYLSLKAKAAIGFLPENPYFYDHLTALEFLDFYGRLFGLKKSERGGRIQELLELVSLEHAGQTKLRKFSRGMTQRIGLAQALINSPDLVILDEPLAGLDPIGRKEIRDIIVQLRSEGRTVFLSSHILQDIEMICDRVAIIADGQIVNQGKLEDLVSQRILYTELVISGVKPERLSPLGLSISSRGDRTLLKVHEEDKLEEIIELVNSSKGKIHSLTPRSETLEDLFVGAVRKT